MEFCCQCLHLKSVEDKRPKMHWMSTHPIIKENLETFLFSENKAPRMKMCPRRKNEPSGACCTRGQPNQLWKNKYVVNRVVNSETHVKAKGPIKQRYLAKKNPPKMHRIPHWWQKLTMLTPGVGSATTLLLLPYLVTSNTIESNVASWQSHLDYTSVHTGLSWRAPVRDGENASACLGGLCVCTGDYADCSDRNLGMVPADPLGADIKTL